MCVFSRSWGFGFDIPSLGIERTSVDFNHDAGASLTTFPRRRARLYTHLEVGLIHAYILQRLACSEHCKLDLPGFKNLEGLHIGMFLA